MVLSEDNQESSFYKAPENQLRDLYTKAEQGEQGSQKHNTKNDITYSSITGTFILILTPIPTPAHDEGRDKAQAREKYERMELSKKNYSITISTRYIKQPY